MYPLEKVSSFCISSSLIEIGMKKLNLDYKLKVVSLQLKERMYFVVKRMNSKKDQNMTHYLTLL